MFSVSSLIWPLLGCGSLSCPCSSAVSAVYHSAFPFSFSGSAFVRPFLCGDGTLYLTRLTFFCQSHPYGFCRIVSFACFPIVLGERLDFTRRVRRYLSGLYACARKIWFLSLCESVLDYNHADPCAESNKHILAAMGSRISLRRGRRKACKD